MKKCFCLIIMALIFSCSKPVEKNKVVLSIIYQDSIKCNLFDPHIDYVRIRTSKLLKESDFKIIKDTFNISVMVYFHIDSLIGRSQEYGIIMKDNTTFFIPLKGSNSVK